MNIKIIAFIFLTAPTLVFAQNKCVSGNCENGNGYWKDISGFTYSGTFKNGQITGKGKLTYSKDYKSGQEVGKNYMHFANALSYEGDLINSEPNGKGKLIFNDEVVLEGKFKNGDFESGKYIFPKKVGFILIGEFVDLQLQSPGTIEFYSGNKYEGEIKNNMPNGKGTMFYPTKSKDVGYWEDGRFLTGTDLDEFDVVKLIKDGGSYLINAKLNGVPVNNMIFDTGAEMVSISASYLPSLIENGTISESDIIGNADFRNADGSINTELVINIREIIIGPKTISNIKASVCTECVMKGINILGLNAIKGLGNIYIDFDNDQIILNRYIR